MSTLDERVSADIEKLATLTEAAAAAKESGEAVGKVHRALSSFITTATKLSDDEKLVVVEQVGDHLGQLVSVIESASKVGEFLNSLTGQDREEGESLAKRLLSAVESGYLEGDTRERVEKVIASWRETAPAKSGRRVGGGTSEPSLPFPVKIKCETHGWESTDRTSKNSARWAAIKHHGEKHANGVRPAKGDAIHTGLTEAIEKLLESNGEGAFDGGGYLVTRGQ